ncbi:hypothetical protein LCGC14_0436510 [marine sediment metagenome]|uniref:Uncharacterized protein n=1 Tax=marine sediment metagenome TaxID=412755 RepID=A0A0F9T4Q5_9ZZZZ
MTHPMLFDLPTPPGPPPGIDFRCATFQEIAATIDEPVAMVIIGGEPDEDRYRRALGLLAQVRRDVV